jgi:hypothetical protein
MVSESGGLNFEPWPRIIPRRVIPVYRSPYGEAHIAQTSRPHMPERRVTDWYAVRGNVGI